MAEQLIISISGLRGIVGQNLTASIAADYGCAFGTFLKRSHQADKRVLSVCIGHDSRPSGEMLSSAVTGGLCSVGISVIDLGLVITPSVGIMVRHLNCAGGVMITASHNPIQYNGIKLLLSDGVAPSSTDSSTISKCYFDRDFDLVPSIDCGLSQSNNQAWQVHVEKVLKLIDTKLIADSAFKVVLDSVNGAGAPITSILFERLACSCIKINDKPTGIFAHSPEPVKENLTALCEAVKQHKAHIGFAQDPDGDRLAIVDENGKYIGEEYTLALAAKYIYSKTTGPAATNLSTSRMIDDIAGAAGSEVFRTPVGEANVAHAMLERNCVIGGEGNGGVIDLRVGPVRDSLVGIVLILSLMAETRKSISQLAAEIPAYHMIKEKFPADKKQAQLILDSARKLFANAKLNSADGLRFDFDDGWLHLRTSNTEPVMRIIVEAQSQSAAQNYIDTVLNIRKEVLG